MDNDNTDDPLEGFNYESVKAFSELSDEEIRIYALTLTSVLEHLRLHIKESEENDNYRRREAIRSQIAINKIKGLINTAQENFENILDINKN